MYVTVVCVHVWWVGVGVGVGGRVEKLCITMYVYIIQCHVYYSNHCHQ
jgi:hypothetical protein